MTSTHLSLLGSLPIDLYDQVIARLSTASETGQAYTVTETVYERQRGGPSLNDEKTGIVAEENILRLRATRTKMDGATPSWVMQVFQRPESVRQSPLYLQRALSEAAISTGNAHALVSSLGYKRKFQLHIKGVAFTRGAVLAEIYQLYPTATSTNPLDTKSHIITFSTRFANPKPTSAASNSNSNASNPHASNTGPSNAEGSTGPQQHSALELKEEAIRRLEEMRSVVRGLVDLGRVE